MLFRDVFTKVVKPLLVHEKEDWENLSKDWRVNLTDQSRPYDTEEMASVQSKEQCRNYCGYLPTCLQWSWTPGECSGSTVVRLGKPAAAPRRDHGKGLVSEGYVSGWMLNRIENAITEMEPCKDTERWITSH